MILNKTIKIGALFTALILMLTGCSINNKTLEKSQKNEEKYRKKKKSNKFDNVENKNVLKNA